MLHTRWFRVIAVGIVLLSAIGATVALQRNFIFHAFAADSGPALTVDISQKRHAISNGIYGMAQDVSSDLQQELKLPMQRWGGDYTTRYNWLQDSSNAGSDWFYMGGSGKDTATPGATVDKIVKSQKDVGGQSLVTIPIIGYVNKTSVWNCSYPSSQYPPQQGYNPYVKLANGDQCGNGKDANGNGLADKDVLSNHIQVNPTWMKAWLQHIIQNYGNSATSGAIYQLDNEPENWNIVHNDVHPKPAGYDELVNASTSYAAMIKATDASAQVMGPSNGYSYGFVHLGQGGKPGDDMASHNGMAWLPYYLQQMKNYQDQHGTRLLDYLDVHYYNDHADNTDDATNNAARLDSTRALWDPTYTGPNSLGQFLSPPQKIGEIPALQNWIQQYYPGTKLSISEYDFGNHKNLNGALTQADVLGIFGQRGLDSANLWDIPATTDPTAYAYRMYLNYDGKGSHFGETSVQSTSANQGQLSVYGAQRNKDGALTLMVINKTGNDLTSNLALSGFTPATNAQVYSYSNANKTAIAHQSDLSVNASGFSTTYPANSISLVVLPNSGTAAPTPTVSSTATVVPTPTVSSTATPTGTPAPTPTGTPVTGHTPSRNNIGVSSDDQTGQADYDGGGNSNSLPALQQAGVVFGKTATIDGVGFTIPSIPVGTADNYQVTAYRPKVTLGSTVLSGSSSRQPITLPVSPVQGAKTLALLCASTNGPSQGNIIITHSDGSQRTAAIGVSDWTLNGGKTQAPMFNNIVAASMPYRNSTHHQNGRETVTTYLFLVEIALQPGETVTQITLPQSPSAGRIHFFAVGTK